MTEMTVCVDLSIGGLVFRTPWTADQIAERLGPPYLEFAVPPVQHPDIVIHSTGDVDRSTLPSVERLDETNNILTWCGPFGSVRIDFDAQRCDLTAVRAISTGWIFRFVVGALFSRYDGLVVHSTGIIHEARAYLYLGPSGAGKTTLSRAAAERGGTILSDETNVVRLEGDRAILYATPLMNVMKWVGNPGCAPLAAMFYLDRSAPRGCSPISPSAAAALLNDALFYRPACPNLANRFLHTTGRLLALFPLVRHSYSLDNIPWPPSLNTK